MQKYIFCFSMPLRLLPVSLIFTKSTPKTLLSLITLAYSLEDHVHTTPINALVSDFPFQNNIQATHHGHENNFVTRFYSVFLFCFLGSSRK